MGVSASIGAATAKLFAEVGANAVFMGGRKATFASTARGIGGNINPVGGFCEGETPRLIIRKREIGKVSRRGFVL